MFSIVILFFSFLLFHFSNLHFYIDVPPGTCFKKEVAFRQGVQSWLTSTRSMLILSYCDYKKRSSTELRYRDSSWQHQGNGTHPFQQKRYDGCSSKGKTVGGPQTPQKTRDSSRERWCSSSSPVFVVLHNVHNDPLDGNRVHQHLGSSQFHNQFPWSLSRGVVDGSAGANWQSYPAQPHIQSHHLSWSIQPWQSHQKTSGGIWTGLAVRGADGEE